MADEWRVQLPKGAQPPYEVFVNGVPQKAGADYSIRGGEIVFTRRLAKEGRLGVWRWTAMALNLFGTYGRNDSVDVQYNAGGTKKVATGLEILGPDGKPSVTKPGE